MGTTLQNGVYLPNEGERNCYAGLKTNWEILDQKVADVTALQQAVAGALHREIVESLPTTDINPNTIYMILSGTSATENVYNEFMYVNNAWELIGTSATDLTNYYTKAEVDGKLLLKASASDLTSHTGDTTIHVTASDKTKWTNSANTVVLRLAKTALTPSSSTNAFSNLDDATALKVGDKVMDTAGVLFEVTAIDTVNSTFTIGTALIDLAQDSDVVHKSGNETIAGEKTFADYSFASSGYGFIGQGNRISYILPEFTGGYSGLSIVTPDFNKSVKIGSWTTDENTGKKVLNTITGYLQISAGSLNDVNTVGITPFNVVNSNLGTSANRWSKIYGTEYYYGSNNVEFSTKFVTTDTAQTISGNKTFANAIKINKEIEFSGNRLAYILPQFSASYSGLSLCTYGSSGAVRIGTWKVDDNDNTKHVLDSSLGYLNISTGSANSINIVYLTPRNSTNSKLGDSTNKWNEINGVEPSSLSLPSGNVSDFIDISSYFTNTGNGGYNTYTAPSNGWVYLSLGDIQACQATILDTNNNRMWGQSAPGTVEQITIPILKGQTLKTQWVTNSTVTVAIARFIPCQGNV